MSGYMSQQPSQTLRAPRNKERQDRVCQCLAYRYLTQCARPVVVKPRKYNTHSQKSLATAETSSTCFLHELQASRSYTHSFLTPSSQYNSRDADNVASDVNLNAQIHCRENLVIHIPVLLQSGKA